MTTRILRQNDILIARIIAPLSDADLLDLKQTLVAQSTDPHCRGVVIDISGLDVIDFFASQTLCEVAEKNRRQGVRTVISGMRSDVEFAMTQLGVTLGDIPTVPNLEEGLDYLG